MTITILTQYFLPEMGAPQNRLFELAKGFQVRGWAVNVVSAMPNYPTGRIFPAYKNKFSLIEEVDGIPVKRYWLYASNSSRAFPRILSMMSFSVSALMSCFSIRKLKPDFILVESPPLTLAFTAWVLSRFSGCKLIMNVSDIWPLSAKELGAIREGIIYRNIEWLEQFLYRKAHICSGQSQEIVDHIRLYKSSNVFLFRNGVDTSRFKLRQEQPDSPQHLKIVYAGLLGVAQGILDICRNVNFSDLGVEFHIYGTGTQREALEKYLEGKNDSGITYHGVMPRNDMPGVLQNFDATLITLVRNIYGAVPSKIYESLASGLPIIFSGEGEGARIIQQNGVGWVSRPGDWNGLSDNLGNFSTIDLAERNLMKVHCREVAIQKFDRKKQIDEFHHYLQSMINSNDIKDN